jgi:hypothetical protein
MRPPFETTSCSRFYSQPGGSPLLLGRISPVDLAREKYFKKACQFLSITRSASIFPNKIIGQATPHDGDNMRHFAPPKIPQFRPMNIGKTFIFPNEFALFRQKAQS